MLAVECRVLSGRRLCDEQSARRRRVQPTVVCRVRSTNLKNEAMARVEPQHQMKYIYIYMHPIAKCIYVFMYFNLCIFTVVSTYSYCMFMALFGYRD
jgi:hypothetical protein